MICALRQLDFHNAQISWEIVIVRLYFGYLSAQT